MKDTIRRILDKKGLAIKMNYIITHNPLNIFTWLKTFNKIPWNTDYHSINLDITYDCSLVCPKCNVCSKYLSDNKYDMTLADIMKFVIDSLKQKYEWKIIYLIGGEPTLHPDLLNIIEWLKFYKKSHPDCRIILVTNGYSTETKEIIKEMPSWVEIKNSNKTSSNQDDFYNQMDAPIDSKKYTDDDYRKACGSPENCGIVLNKNGYYFCPLAPTIDIMFYEGKNGIKELKDAKDMDYQRLLFCKYCGTFIVNKEGRIKKEFIVSESWKKALKRIRT